MMKQSEREEFRSLKPEIKDRQLMLKKQVERKKSEPIRDRAGAMFNNA